MVKKIEAFQADDGKVFETHREALEHDAIEVLKKLEVFNHASAMAVIKWAPQIVAVLAPLAEYQDA